MRVFKYIWPSVVVALIIFYLCCLIPSNEIPLIEWDFFVEKDKLVHFLMYFGLAIVTSFNYIYLDNGHIIILKYIAFALLLPVLYGGLIEIIQSEYITERSGDWFDFLANTIGVFASIPFSLWFRKYLLNKQLREEI